MDSGQSQSDCPFGYLAAATAAAATATVDVTAGISTVAVYEDDGYNDEPYPVIVNEIAKTVVVHKSSSFQIFKVRICFPALCYHNMQLIPLCCKI
jgi:hypothetical protein